jgi:hypothetical protein
MTKFNGSRRFPNVKKINTKILSQIVEGRDGRTDAGSDYGAMIDDITSELYRRQNVQAIKKQRSHEDQERQHELETHGRQCTQCKVYYPLDTIDANFYKVTKAPHRYRPRCKACHVKASRINRIKIEDIPF